MAPTTATCPRTGCGFATEAGEPSIVAAQLTIHGMEHATTNNNSNVKKPERPEVVQDMSESEWSEFCFNFNNYKRDAKIEGKVQSIRSELQQCCSKTVRTRLYQMKGDDLNDISEIDMLECIKKACVNKVSVAQHRSNFFAMNQNQGETPQSHLARLKAKASLCKFTVKFNCSEACTKNVPKEMSYDEDVVESQLIAGLINPDHRDRLLLEADKLPNLDEKMAYLDLLHMNENSRPEIRNDERSQYAKNKLKDKEEKKCGCGKAIETRNEKHTLCRNCFDKTKTKTCTCGVKIIPSKSCCFTCAKKKKEEKDVSQQSQTVDPKEQKDYYMSPMSAEEKKWQRSKGREWARQQRKVNSSTTIPGSIKPIFSHARWDGEKFVTAEPMPQPMIDVKITPMKEAMKAWRVDNGVEKADKRSAYDEKTVSARFNGSSSPHLADSGAMTCSVTPELCRSMGISPAEYLNTDIPLKGACGRPLPVKGCIMAKIALGKKLTHQIMYVLENPSGSVLSREALIELGIVHPEFPKQMYSGEEGVSMNSSEVRECECVKRKPSPELPKTIPFEPKPENREKFENWILEEFKDSAFNKCSHQPLPGISGEPMKIHFREGAVPYAVYTPAKIPLHYKAETKKMLEDDVRLGVIEQVPEGTPTKWCSRMLMQVKSNGKLRRTVDLQKVNAATYREVHHNGTPYDLVCDLPKGQKKTVLDGLNSYHALPLEKEASEATTFVTEWGTFRYRRAPQGFWASGDCFTRRFHELTKDVKNKRVCIDDSLLFENTLEEAFWSTIKYIKNCYDNGVVFNPKKFQFGRDEVTFGGFELTEDGYRPTKSMLQSIGNFPVPRSITDVRAFFGLIEQVSYAFSKSSVMAPFRDLLKKSSDFYWDERLNELFINARQHIVDKVHEGVKTFELGKETALTTDYSKEGMGFFLQQKHCKCPDISPHCSPGHWKLVVAGSRFTKDAEKNYSPVEGEALAMTYGLYSTKMYCLGNTKLTVGVDHKPLLAIMGHKEMEKIENPRLLSFKRKCTSQFQYRMLHIPGKKHVGPDVTSRYPGGPGDAPQLLDEEDECDDENNNGIESSRATFHTGVETSRAKFFLKNKSVITESITMMCMVSGNTEVGEEDFDYDDQDEAVKISSMQTLDSFETIRWEDLREACVLDTEATEIARAIKDGFPEVKNECPESLKRVWHFKEDLYEVDGIPMVNRRLYVPKEMRREVLETLHSAHQGTSGMKASARDRFWWPGMDAAITQMRDQCRYCNEKTPSQPGEEWLEEETPSFPFESICLDYFQTKGNHYLATADRYSGWLDVYKVKSTAFAVLEAILRERFMWHGVPDVMSTDGGPPFNGNSFKAFCTKWKIRHRLSSAGYPESNGRAELAVKSAKRMVEQNLDSDGGLNSDKMVRAVLQYRNTPLRGSGESPAEIVYGQKLSDNLPRAPHEMWRRINDNKELGMARLKMEKTDRYNADKHNLEPLHEGDLVLVQNMCGPLPNRWSRTGSIVENLGNRQYHVRIDGSRRILLRNRKNLKRISPLKKDETYKVKMPVYETTGSPSAEHSPIKESSSTERSSIPYSPRYTGEAASPTLPTPTSTPQRPETPEVSSPPSGGASNPSRGANNPSTPRRQIGTASPRRIISPDQVEKSPEPSPNVKNVNNGSPPERGETRRIRKRPVRFDDYETVWE